MKMGHCLLIFIFPLLLLEKCVSQYEDKNNGFKEDLSTNHNHLSKILEHHVSKVGFSSNESEGMEPFNKTVFVIPITGILLVITMVLLYIFYTWNLSREENETNLGKTCIQDFPLTEEFPISGQGDGNLLSPITNLQDSPPSYLEATTAITTNPPTYSSSIEKSKKNPKISE